MHTLLGGVNTPQFLYDTPRAGECAWVGVLGCMVAQAFAVFREVVSTSTEFGLRT
jgi:hypothetical protein